MLKINKEAILAYFKNKKIAVLAGGLSDEREISLRSGKNVYASLKTFPSLDVELIDVDRNIASVLKEKKIDFAYNTLHGTYGEDGSMQGVLDFLNIGYTGEDVLRSALCSDKVKTKEIWRANSVNTPAFSLFSDFVKTESGKVYFENETLSLPVVVKPRANGSSVDVSIVKTEEEILNIVKTKDGKKYFAEEYIKGSELTVGIMASGKSHYIFPILGIKPKNEFYDFEAKYTKGMTSFEIPAKLSEEIACKVREEVVNGYGALECEGLCRIDVMLRDGIPFLIENNTQPGMTDTSDIPEMARCEGIDVSDLVLFILGSKIKDARG